MSVIQTASQITTAFKNVGRAREIITVFSKHGFQDLFHRMGLSNLINRSQTDDDKAGIAFGKRLKMAFEELGPAFVKLGQTLAQRPDILQENIIDELATLQDRVNSLAFSEIKKHLETQLGKPISDVFSYIDEKPVGAASIAQVHYAILRTGEPVAVKIQRPHIQRIIQNDIAILRTLASLLEKYIPETRPFNPSGIVEEFFKTLLFELDFRVEANNLRKIAKNLHQIEGVKIPAVYLDYSHSKVLVLERFDGIRFSDTAKILSSGASPAKLIEKGAHAFFHMVMHDGLFHGDLHAGNLFLLENETIGIIDFGIVGRLSRRIRDSIITMFIAIMDEDYETLANEYVSLSSKRSDTDFSRLHKDLMDTISPYVGMSLGDVNLGQLLLRSTTVAVRHDLTVPRELMLLFKAMVSIDALGKKLDSSFDVLGLGNKLAREILQMRYSKDRISHDLLLIGRELQGAIETFPSLLKRFLQVSSQNNFAIHTRSADTNLLAKTLAWCALQFVSAVTAVCLVAIGIALLTQSTLFWIYGFPLVSVLFIFSGLTLLGRSLWLARKFFKNWSA